MSHQLSRDDHGVTVTFDRQPVPHELPSGYTHGKAIYGTTCAVGAVAAHAAVNGARPCSARGRRTARGWRSLDVARYGASVNRHVARRQGLRSVRRP